MPIYLLHLNYNRIVEITKCSLPLMLPVLLLLCAMTIYEQNEKNRRGKIFALENETHNYMMGLSEIKW